MELTLHSFWQIAASFLTLTILEVVLSVDNIIFISIITAKLPQQLRHRANRLGLSLAILGRAAMLAGLSWIIHWQAFTWHVAGYDLSPRSLVLLIGGLYLMWKSTVEMHNHVEGDVSEQPEAPRNPTKNLGKLLMVIVWMDMVFAVDSVFTAIGIAEHLWVMIAAMVIAMIVMIIFVNRIGDFINAHPTLKVLALSFLILVGLALVLDAFELPIPKGYLYFAIGFSMSVEALNIRWRRNARENGKSE